MRQNEAKLRAIKSSRAEGQPVVTDIAAAATPARFRGKPAINSSRCPDGCVECLEAHLISTR